MQILISPRALAKVEDRIEVESVGELTLKGFHRPIPAYNVLGIRGGEASQ
jgi:class 3 adenylate cyclase